MKIVEVKHPLVKHKIGLMREHDISTKRFRELAAKVGSLLTYEATADLETERATVEGWCGPVEVDHCCCQFGYRQRATTGAYM